MRLRDFSLRCMRNDHHGKPPVAYYLLLLIATAVVLEPACDMPTLWIVMGPVNDAALRIRFKLTIERHQVTVAQRRYSRRKIDIVRDQHCLA